MKTVKVKRSTFEQLLSAESDSEFLNIFFSKNLNEGENLRGGLDHISYKKNEIQVLDRGCNGKANDFRIIPE